MFVYALRDPDSGDIRYVGKTTYADPARRLKLHVRDGKYSCPGRRRTRVQEWIAGLASPPLITVLASDPPEGLNACEISWIARLRDTCGLVNITKGGAGVSSREHKSGRPKGFHLGADAHAVLLARLLEFRAARSTCRRGHSLEPHPSQPGRFCRVCQRATKRKWAARRRAVCYG